MGTRSHMWCGFETHPVIQLISPARARFQKTSSNLQCPVSRREEYQRWSYTESVIALRISTSVVLRPPQTSPHSTTNTPKLTQRLVVPVVPPSKVVEGACAATNPNTEAKHTADRNIVRNPGSSLHAVPEIEMWCYRIPRDDLSPGSNAW